MPILPNSPILSLQRKGRHKEVMWEEVPLHTADNHQELIGLFLKKQYSSRRFSEACRLGIQRLLEKQDPSVQHFVYEEPQTIVQAALASMSHTIRFKINLDVLNEWRTDEWEQSDQQLFYNNLIYFIGDFSSYNKTISFSFQEVFFVPEEHQPPSHYREGIDILVSDLDEYKKHVSSLSYQLKKILFFIHKPKQDATPTHARIINYAQDTAVSNTTNPALKNIHSFSDVFQASYSLDHCEGRGRVFNCTHVHLAFGPAVTLQQLPILFDSRFFIKGNVTDMVLTLQGAQYNHPATRAEVRDVITRIISQTKQTFMIHVVLLTQEDPHNRNLFDLEPDKTQEIDGFSPLSEESGYYLSDPRIFSTIIQNIQAIQATLPRHRYPQFNTKQKTITPAVFSFDNTLTTPATTHDFRETKRWTKTQLQSNATLSLTQALNQNMAQDINEEQTVNQRQVIHQSHAQHITQHVKRENLYWFKDTIDFNGFCDYLKTHAQKYLERKHDKDRFDFYVTEGYRIKKKQFWHDLANNALFRAKAAANLFQVGYTVVNERFQAIVLPTISVDNMIKYLLLADFEIETIVPDGLLSNECEYERSVFGSRTLSQYFYCWNSRLFSQTQSMPIPENSILSLMAEQSTKPESWQCHMPCSVLLQEDVLSDFSHEQQEKYITLANNLLRLYEPNQTFTPDEITDLEEQLIQLTSLYIQDTPEYVTVLQRFIAVFEDHTADNLKIMVHLLMTHEQDSMRHFLYLLTHFEARSLLQQTYRLYFKYSDHIVSLSRLLDTPTIHEQNTNSKRKQICFLTLSELTPKCDSPKDWPDFEAFAHHLLLYYAKQRQNIDFITLERLETFWQKIYSTCLIYSNHQTDEAAQLMHEFVTQFLSSDEGLNTPPVTQPQFLFDGIELILNTAKTHHTLPEQMRELKGVSLLPMYGPHAMKHDAFKIVCWDMMISPDTMDPITKSYCVSSDLLRHRLLEETQAHIPLKVSIFRYLGGQTIRDDIDFYRTLLNTQTLDDPLHEIIVGYFVLTHTGDQYKPKLDNDSFSHAFHAFIQTKHLPIERIQAGLDSFFKAYQDTPRDEMTGNTSLWQICHKELPQTDSIPVILTKKFDKKTLMHFLLMHRDELMSTDIPALPETTMSLLKTLVHTQFTEVHIKASEKILLALFPYYYPAPLTFQTFINDLVKINALIKGYAHIVQDDRGTRLFMALKTLLATTHSLDDILTCFDCLIPGGVPHHHSNAVPLAATFIHQLSTKKTVLSRLGEAKGLLQEVLEEGRKTNASPTELNELLDITERLLVLEIPDAQKTLQRLLPLWQSPDGYAFFHAVPFTGQQLKQTTTLLERFHLPFSFLIHGLREDPLRDFNDIEALFNTCLLEQVVLISTLSMFLFKTGAPFLQTVTHLHTLPEPILEQLTNLVECKAITQAKLARLLTDPHLDKTIRTIEQQLYTQNTSRFEYDPERITKKIAEIRYRSGENGDGCPLDAQLQADLLQDYHCMMSYISINPVLIEQDDCGKQTPLTIHELHPKHFRLLFETVKHKIIHKEQQHAHELLLLALCCEALYRTQAHFPRDTQLISILNALRQKKPLIQGIKTSEGKSLITAIHSVLLCAKGQTVERATENNKLAWDGLTRFRRFYEYLGIPCATTVLQADSPRHAYVDNGINCSTAAGFELFHKQMLLELKPLPTTISLILDEGDANLTTTVDCRIAASFNPLFQNVHGWSLLYDTLLDFVQEPELFINNPCSRADDIRHFKTYFLQKNTSKTLTEFIQAIPNNLLDEPISSAQIAWSLDEDVHFRILPKNKEKTRYYAAPILENTKRPDIKVGYSDSVQPLLHARLKRQWGARYVFETESNSETIIISSMKNALDRYRLNGGDILCFTATPGSDVEVSEFKAHYDLDVFFYPSFFDETLSHDLGIQCATNAAHQEQRIIEILTGHKTHHPEQPCLIITHDPKSAMALTRAVRERVTGFIQCYLGDDQEGDIEETIIQRAGLNGNITITTESLARGADFKPEHARGLFVINLCTNITQSQHIQINGRAGRNGKPGAYLSIINQEELIVPFSENLHETIQANQHQISVNAQRERLKTRLLEEAREYIVCDHILALRMKVDAILKRQVGHGYEFMTHSLLLTTLRDINERAENQYTRLLGEKAQLTADERELFLQTLIDDYQAILNRVLPESHFQTVQVIEPIIQLEEWQLLPELDALRAGDLSVLCGVLSFGWTYMGNQKMQQLPFILDHLLIEYDAYINGQKSFKYATAALIKKYLDMNHANTKGLTDAFLAQKETAHAFIDLCKKIPIIGPFLPVEKTKTDITNYITKMAHHIEQEEWDALTLPEFSSMMQQWYDGLTQVAQITSAFATVTAGPIPFVINYVIVPTLGSFIKQIFKDSESMYAQILLGLDSILSDTKRALLFLTSITDAQTISVGTLLDNLGPLLKNKTFVALLSYALKQNHFEHFIPYLKALPDALEALHPYRSLPLKALLTGERLIGLMLQVAQLDDVKIMMGDNRLFQTLLTKIPMLHPDFFSTFNQLSAKQMAGFIKVAAHPECFKYLNQLPPETQFSDISLWLRPNIPIETLPVEAREAVMGIRTYQENRERIAEDTKHALLSLRHEFELSTAQMSHYLEHLQPHEPTPLIPSIPQKKTPWIKIIGYGVLGVGLIALNIFFFSIPLLLTTLMLVAWYTYSSLKSDSSHLTKTSHELPIENTASVDNTPVPPLLTLVNPNTPASDPKPLHNWRSNVAPSNSASLIRLGIHAPKNVEETLISRLPLDAQLTKTTGTTACKRKTYRSQSNGG